MGIGGYTHGAERYSRSHTIKTQGEDTRQALLRLHGTDKRIWVKHTGGRGTLDPRLPRLTSRECDAFNFLWPASGATETRRCQGRSASRPRETAIPHRISWLGHAFRAASTAPGPRQNSPPVLQAGRQDALDVLDMPCIPAKARGCSSPKPPSVLFPFPGLEPCISGR